MARTRGPSDEPLCRRSPIWKGISTAAVVTRIIDDPVFQCIAFWLTGPEVWPQGWGQFFLVRSQATVTSPLERFIYYFFDQTVAEGSVHLSGAGVMI